MPSEIHHQIITRQALKSAGVSHAEKLIEDYCTFPDHFHSRYDEIKPYIFIYEGIEFHYPPHTPVDEFYRYWQYVSPDTCMLSTAENRNRSFSEAGFKFYLDNILHHLTNGESDEAHKFLGSLLHYLEDSAFGIHALEGPDGTDIYTIDRMSGRDFAKYLCAIPPDESWADITVTPRIFASYPEEFSHLLYRRYCDCTAISRRAVFDTAMEYITGKSANSTWENQKIMFTSALQLAADTIATLYALAAGTAPEVMIRKLVEFSPYHYPIGGGGGFQLKRYAEVDNTIAFGINLEARLLYFLPDDFYSKFTGIVTGKDIEKALLQIINDGEVVEEYHLAGDCRLDISLPSPRNRFGFIIKAQRGIGTLHISDGTFIRH